MTRHLRSVGVVSVAKVFAVLYAIVGLFIGGMVSLFFLLAALIGASSGLPSEMGGAMSLLFGVAAIIIFPIFYGIIGAVGGLMMSALYNLVAKYVGGIELEIE